MTTLPLPYGLVATIEEDDRDRLDPPPTHDWRNCQCAICASYRAALLLRSS